MWIFMKLCIKCYINLLISSGYSSELTATTDTLHEDLIVFLRAEVTKWGIPSWGIFTVI
jgi:hypothetical protein